MPAMRIVMSNAHVSNAHVSNAHVERQYATDLRVPSPSEATALLN